MGMRCDQLMGLSVEAADFLKKNSPIVKVYTRKTYPNKLVFESSCEVVELQSKPSGKKYFGMFDQAYDLLEYTLNDGRVVEEFIQAAPWSSGSCFFLALQWKEHQDTSGVLEMLKWSEEEINAV